MARVSMHLLLGFIKIVIETGTSSLFYSVHLPAMMEERGSTLECDLDT